ncbi:MAG: four helix bundle protein [Candidatus Omnitrophica bacterium]|nr:four helix bundle protein [Candidatus Omnitrophota bacterium]
MDEKFKQRIYKYIIRLIEFLESLPKNLVAKEISKQLIRSGTSIGANYFESQGASSKKDYQNFFAYSLKSANESRFWFNVLIDSQIISGELVDECKWLLKETEEFAKIFASSILTMKNKK